jgi:hypothetical protein
MQDSQTVLPKVGQRSDLFCCRLSKAATGLAATHIMSRASRIAEACVLLVVCGLWFERRLGYGITGDTNTIRPNYQVWFCAAWHMVNAFNK